MNLSIKNVPESVVEKLKARAARDHRSLQGELLHIVKSAVDDERPVADAWRVLAEARRSGLVSPDESTAMIREDRDGR